MAAWTFLHIVTMFQAVGLGVGAELLMHRVARTRDVLVIRQIFRLARPIERAVPVLFVIGLGFGIVAVFAGRSDFLAPWLLISYAIFAIGMAAGGGMFAPWAEKVSESSEASPADAPYPELQRLLQSKRGEYGTGLNIAVIVAILFVMVTKPLS